MDLKNLQTKESKKKQKISNRWIEVSKLKSGSKIWYILNKRIMLQPLWPITRKKTKTAGVRKFPTWNADKKWDQSNNRDHHHSE